MKSYKMKPNNSVFWIYVDNVILRMWVWHPEADYILSYNCWMSTSLVHLFLATPIGFDSSPDLWGRISVHSLWYWLRLLSFYNKFQLCNGLIQTGQHMTRFKTLSEALSPPCESGMQGGISGWKDRAELFESMASLAGKLPDSTELFNLRNFENFNKLFSQLCLHKTSVEEAESTIPFPIEMRKLM